MRISPAIPVVANLLLAALWGFSVFAGWGPEAFCSEGGCVERLDGVSRLSALFAVIAACCTAGAWLAPRARRDEDRLTALMIAALAVWVIAEGILFVGGLIVR
ncbi:hypothetical protein [Streptosporangium lutulentum]|uniref:Uncharacterized protein n=1 Tax=Streptosporangium lutulentum TaxID=1461250 RepID=A0ABT9QNZ3_9ACTN|nr:hypothetical protein [Streptosporangium lutulentum]MDP9848487.1 hypothetical protein [Streptosporangium lutulentum]